MLKNIYIGGGVKRNPPERRAYECLPQEIDGDAEKRQHRLGL